MPTSLVLQSLTWLVAAFFLIGAIINGVAPRSIRADYARWGYPGWFHFVTAALEALVVVLLFVPGGAFAGAVLGALIMVAATGTTMLHREYKRAIAPALALLLAVALAWMIASGRG